MILINGGGTIVPNRWQVFLEGIFQLCMSLSTDTIDLEEQLKKGKINKKWINSTNRGVDLPQMKRIINKMDEILKNNA